MKKIKSALVKIVVVSLILIWAGYTVQSYVNSVKFHYKSENESIRSEEGKKIEEIKKQIVQELAIDCEVKGVPEGQRNGKTIMDTNGYYSRGMWQFQTKTIQYYYEYFYKKQITVDEAVLIAHTEEKARNLAYDIIWKDEGGIFNWENCSNKLGLHQKIEIIKQLEK